MYCGRPPSASPATGNKVQNTRELNALLSEIVGEYDIYASAKSAKTAEDEKGGGGKDGSSTGGGGKNGGGKNGGGKDGSSPGEGGKNGGGGNSPTSAPLTRKPSGAGEPSSPSGTSEKYKMSGYEQEHQTPSQSQGQEPTVAIQLPSGVSTSKGLTPLPATSPGATQLTVSPSQGSNVPPEVDAPTNLPLSTHIPVHNDTSAEPHGHGLDAVTDLLLANPKVNSQKKLPGSNTKNKGTFYIDCDITYEKSKNPSTKNDKKKRKK